MLRRFVAAAAAVGLIAILLAFLLAPPPPRASAQAPVGPPLYAPGEVLVQFLPGATPQQRQDVLRLVGAGPVQHIRTAAMRADGAPGLDRVAVSLPVERAVALLSRQPGVEFAEPNWVLTHQEVSNDPYYTGGKLWGMYGPSTSPYANTFGCQAGATWAAGKVGSSEVVVGVIDEGIDFSHPELADNAWTNPGEIAGNGIDDDGNGYIDDINGWDFFGKDSSVYHAGLDSHGTHVAGTIGAKGGNGVGVAGVCWNVKMISARFLGPYGGYTSDAVLAVDYITDLKANRGINIVATNNSWGGGSSSQALLDAIIRAAKADILFVAAAGNSGQNTDRRKSYPSCYNTTSKTKTQSGASYDAVVSVAAIDESGAKAGFSNYGLTTVDLGAPGVAIESTKPGGTYQALSGTSMATPHVTGAVALYAASHPGSSASAIKQAILDAARATPTASMAGRTLTGGRLNVSGF